MDANTGITKHLILEIVIMLYLAQLVFPLPFQYLPFQLSSNYFYSALVFATFAILYPRSYLSKGLLAFYVFIFVRLFFTPLFWSNREYGYEGYLNLKSTIINFYPLFIAILVYFHYINKQDYYTLGRICKRVLILSLIGVINSLFIFRTYPDAMMEYVGSEAKGTQILAARYKSLGLLGYGFFNALCSIFPLFVYMIKTTTIHTSKKIWWILLAVITWITILLTNTTAFFLFATIFGIAAWILRPDYKKDIYILIALLLVVIFIIPSSFTAQIFYKSSELFPESKIGIRLYDAGLTIENPYIDYYSSPTHAGMRLGRIPLLWESFLSNPLIGGGLNTGHVAWLDMLSMFGLLGFVPWLWLIIDNYKRNLKIIHPTYIPYYMLCVIAFVAMGFLKNTGYAHTWIFWFLIAPGANFIYINNYNDISNNNYIMRVNNNV